MNNHRKSSGTNMRKYYQLILVVVCFISIITLLIYRHEYYRLRYVLEVLNFFGKPGLSEIEFCGPGFNATMLTEMLRNSSMEIRETPPLFQEIDENFYSFSSFLQSYEKYEKLTPAYVYSVDTIVIGKVHVQPNFRCNIWNENDPKPKAGRFTFKIISNAVNEHHLYLFHCSLNKNLGKPIGISFYKNDYNINPIHAPINKLISVDTKRPNRGHNNIKFVNNIQPAICVIPNQVPIVSRDAFVEFLVFHHMMGIDKFIIYDSMISEDIIQRLNLLPTQITQWSIQFYPLNYPFVFAKSYEILRATVELDCLFRHYKIDNEETNRVSHIVVLTWDEFLVPRIHSNVKSALGEFDPLRKLRTVEVKSLPFCLNQNDDENSDITYPNIMKKTHYYMLPEKSNTINIRNLDSMKSFEDISHLNSSSKIISLETLAVQKYSYCRDTKSFQPSGVGYNETQMQVFQHKFEGAMLKFNENLQNNKIYRLFRSGKIWEKGIDYHERDML